jgi:hypothetical protein
VAANEYMRDYFIRREVFEGQDDTDSASVECIVDRVLSRNETSYSEPQTTDDNCGNHHHENFS